MSGIILFYLLGATYSSGQVPGDGGEKFFFKKGNTESTPVHSKMKTDTIGILEADYPEVARKFAVSFPSAQNQLWIKEAGSLYVSFLTKNKRFSAVFTIEGNMGYAIATVKAADIPPDIAQKIKNNYSDYSVFSVKEIIVDASTIYQVLLENRVEYIIIRINSEEMEESERVSKIL